MAVTWDQDPAHKHTSSPHSQAALELGSSVQQRETQPVVPPSDHSSASPLFRTQLLWSHPGLCPLSPCPPLSVANRFSVYSARGCTPPALDYLKFRVPNPPQLWSHGTFYQASLCGPMPHFLVCMQEFFRCCPRRSPYQPLPAAISA